MASGKTSSEATAELVLPKWEPGATKIVKVNKKRQEE
jgi:hypothetical protein